MIKDSSDQKEWQFVFLSAGLAAIGDAQAIGIHADAVLLLEKSVKGSAGAWTSLSDRTADYRSAGKNKIGFEQNDRKHPDDPEMKKT